ncbi:MAG: hypothetical protein ACR2M6_00905 [Vampirovibrionia bacterium]
MTIEQALQFHVTIMNIPQDANTILSYGKEFITQMYHNIGEAMYILDTNNHMSLADDLASLEAIWTHAFFVSQ